MTETRQPQARLPLAGVTVVALEQAVAAPFATRQLADLGARVIKIERPGSGDFARGYDETVWGMSSYFVWLNRGKESVTLDVKDREDRALLEAMLGRADVFVQNLAPGAAARLGLDEPVLRAKYPRLVTCAISGYGPAGPYRDKKAYDLLVQCETGLLSVTGTPDEPVKVGISVADIAAGMYAYSGILAALYERERTGRGTGVEVAMIDALGEWVSQPYLYTAYSGTPPPRAGARHASIAPYGPYRAGDGGQVFVGIQNEREWQVFCATVLARPDLATDARFATNPRRVANNGELTDLIEQALSAFTAEQVVERLDAVGIANARMRTIADFADHPQLAARDRWRYVDTPVRPVRCLLPPVTVAGREAAMGAVPDMGQHTAAVRAEFAPTRPAEPAGADAGGIHTSVRTELIIPEPAEALAGLLDVAPPDGDRLPPLWHWVYLLDRRRHADLGPDGHPTRGIPAPPGPGRLRMVAGGRVVTHAPLRFGVPATRTTRVVRTVEKQGRSGPLTFVTVRSEIVQDEVLAVSDEQDIVYRVAGTTLRDPSPPDPERGGQPDLALRVDSALLFRFSALTYNAHRIHYDRDYARQEGYADRVVHGPLQALMMGEAIRRRGVEFRGRQFSYRLVAPMVGEQTFTVHVRQDQQRWVTEVRDGQGRLTATGVLHPG